MDMATIAISLAGHGRRERGGGGEHYRPGGICITHVNLSDCMAGCRPKRTSEHGDQADADKDEDVMISCMVPDAAPRPDRDLLVIAKFAPNSVSLRRLAVFNATIDSLDTSVSGSERSGRMYYVYRSRSMA